MLEPSPKSAPYEVLENTFSGADSFPEVRQTDSALSIEHQQRYYSSTITALLLWLFLQPVTVEVDEHQ